MIQVVQVYTAILHEYSLSKLFWHFVSSIVNEAIKTISSQFFLFFFTRRFWAYKKHQNPKQMIPTLLEVFVRAKSCCLCLLIFVYVDWFWLICAFALSKYFHKKKIINWLEIVLIASFTILLTCTPINPSIENSFVRSYFYFQSSVKISFSMRICLICENLFESLSFVWSYVFMKISKCMNTLV